jgi:hypothetical protein
MKIQTLFSGAVMLGIIAFTSPKINFPVLKNHQSSHKFTTVVMHLYGITDDNSHVIDKLLFNLDDNGSSVTINYIALYDGSGGTCNGYGSVAWPSGNITHGITYHANNLQLTYVYPGGGSGSVTLNINLSSGGIICD